MEAIESIDRECAALGGLFQQVVNDMKTGVPHYEDFINKAAKLHSHLKNTILALGSFLDTFQKIADAATNTKGATREIGACLTRIVIRHKAMEARMKTLSSALLDCLVLPLQEKMEEWKKIAHSLDKEHSKEYKKLRSELKKKFDNQTKLMKKNKKSSKGDHIDPKVDQGLLEVTKSVRSLHEVEKSAVRRVLVEERSRYCTFVACLKPVLGEEISMVSELQQLEEVMTKLDKHTEDPFKLPEASEQVLIDIKTTEGGVVFQTPPSSPSSLGSRKSSMCSISSAGSSSGGSTNSPSHQAQQHRHLRHNQGVNNPMVAPLRLSSISSQDSGFTSQDTLFLRPGSPGSGRAKTPDGSDGDLSGSGGSTPGANNWPGLVQGMPGPPMTDRPHTISSAYEKSHQRPLLQPYTFNPPDKTIPEEDERVNGLENGETYAVLRKPPVPQRCISLDRPSVPGKTPAAMMAKQKLVIQSQLTTSGSHQQLPNFQCNQPDMVVPVPVAQPVYMNMSDLDRMRQQKLEQQQSQEEDGLDLKTPTQEDLDNLPSSSDGSSSGYGSQNLVMEQQQQGYNDVPAPAPLLDANKYQRHSLQRPFSFTNGVIPEAAFSQALGAQLGVNGRGTLLRRSCSQVSSSKPAPPTRRTPSVISQDEGEGGPGHSNTTTPRGSMEFLPPPPPHLLHSDEEDEGAKENAEIVTKRCPSVSESIKKMQRQGQGSHPSPGTLRRVQSMSGPPGHHNAADRQQIMARLDAALASPRGPRPVSPNVRGHQECPQQDQIYAPVAALQQKIQQQQQARMAQSGHCVDPGLMPHPPGPILNQSSFNSPKSRQNQSEGEEYGFGMQFQVQSQNFYQQKQNHHPQQHQHPPQHPQQYQMRPGQHPQYPGHPPSQPHHYPQHDQIMSEMDPTLSQRPQPPGMGWPQNGGHGRGPGAQNHDPSAAKVRQWIETRTVSDVRKVRPVLNQEIQKGFQLRKAIGVKDRSQPRFF